MEEETSISETIHVGKFTKYKKTVYLGTCSQII